jgi:hypothetical protein
MSQVIFGLVPHPPFQDRLVKDAENWAWDPLGTRRVYGLCQHTMVGTLWGTDAYFRRGSASTGLTDYGIGGASDGADDGLILRWNDPFGGAHPGISANKWPWASGPTDGLEGDGPAFVTKYGSNAVNGYLVSVERSDGGNPDVPASPKYIESIAQLMAYYADQAACAYDEFPLLPVTGLTFHYWHSEFSTKSCPAGSKAATDQIQDRVKQILTQYQTGGVPPDEDGDPLADIAKSAYELDPNLIWPNASTGAVGKLWREYGEATGIFNPPGQPWNDVQSDGTKLFQFEGGPLVATTKDGKTGIVVNVK